MALQGPLRRRWRLLKSGTPGERFQRYYARQHDRHGNPVVRSALIAGGLLLVLAGLVLMPAPGPGIVVVAVGGAMLAGSSRLAARALDRIELGVRRLLRKAR